MVNFANECMTKQGVLLAYGTLNITDPVFQQFPQQENSEAVRDLAGSGYLQAYWKGHHTDLTI